MTDTETLLRIIPRVSVDSAIPVFQALLEMQHVEVTWEESDDLPEGKDGHICPAEYDADGNLVLTPHKVHITVRRGTDVRWQVWGIGHEMIHHCQLFRLWPPEEEFVETLDFILAYALRGILALRQEVGGDE